MPQLLSILDYLRSNRELQQGKEYAGTAQPEANPNYGAIDDSAQSDPSKLIPYVDANGVTQYKTPFDQSQFSPQPGSQNLLKPIIGPSAYYNPGVAQSVALQNMQGVEGAQKASIAGGNLTTPVNQMSPAALSILSGGDLRGQNLNSLQQSQEEARLGLPAQAATTQVAKDFNAQQAYQSSNRLGVPLLENTQTANTLQGDIGRNQATQSTLTQDLQNRMAQSFGITPVQLQTAYQQAKFEQGIEPTEEQIREKALSNQQLEQSIQRRSLVNQPLPTNPYSINPQGQLVHTTGYVNPRSIQMGQISGIGNTSDPTLKSSGAVPIGNGMHMVIPPSQSSPTQPTPQVAPSYNRAVRTEPLVQPSTNTLAPVNTTPNQSTGTIGVDKPITLDNIRKMFGSSISNDDAKALAQRFLDENQ